MFEYEQHHNEVRERSVFVREEHLSMTTGGTIGNDDFNEHGEGNRERSTCQRDDQVLES
jgi:hypothetical protein